MEQLSQVELRGVIGSIRHTILSGTSIARISVVTQFAYKDNEGCAVVDSSWHNIVAWEGKGTQVLGDLQKGDKVYVKGRLRYTKYVSGDRAEHIAAEIVANEIEKLTGEEPLEYQM